ncbi:hypothetical protein CYMTET_17502, partial [Cymbomonas tetramitiformis]
MSDANKARQLAHVPLEPESIYSRLMRTRKALAFRPKSETELVVVNDDKPKLTRALLDIMVDKLDEEVNANIRLQETAAQVREHKRLQEEQSSWRPVGQARSSVEPLQDFLGTYGVRGDAESAKRVTRRATLRQESTALSSLLEECGVSALPLLRVILRTFLFLLAVPRLLINAARHVCATAYRVYAFFIAKLGKNLFFTMSVFVVLSLSASAVSTYVSYFEYSPPSHAVVHHLPGEFAKLNALYASMRGNTPDRLDPAWWQAVADGSQRASTTSNEDAEYPRYHEWHGQVFEDGERRHRSADGRMRLQDGDRSSGIIPSPYRMAHAPALLSLPNGDVICAWTAGEAEGADGTGIATSILKRGHSAWSDAKVVSRVKGRALARPTLFYTKLLGSVDDTSVAVLLYSSQAAYQGVKTSELRALHSRDFGASWYQAEPPFEVRKRLPELLRPLLPVCLRPPRAGTPGHAMRRKCHRHAQRWPCAGSTKIGAPSAQTPPLGTAASSARPPPLGAAASSARRRPPRRSGL